MLLTGGYGLMTCWGSVFTVALCLQVAGPFGGAGEGVGVGRLGHAHFPFAPPPAPAAGLFLLDALPGHGLHLRLHPQLWHRPW